MPKLFISYRQLHHVERRRVRTFAERVRDCGIEVVFDQFYLDDHPGGPPEKWYKWSSDHAINSERVIIIGSKSWFLCFDGKEKPGTGLGAACEADDLRTRIYNTANINENIRIVIFDDKDAQHISFKLKGYHYFHAQRDFTAIIKWLGGTLSQDPKPVPNSEKTISSLQQLRVEAVGILKGNPDAVEVLAKRLPENSQLPPDGAEHPVRCEQVVNALVTVDVAVAVKALVLGYLDASNDQRGGPAPATARTIELLCYTMLPVIYEPNQISQVSLEMQKGGALIALPVMYKQTVEFIMAGVDGRRVKFLAPADAKTLPHATLHLHHAPEMGFDAQNDQFIDAFRAHLAARFVPAGGRMQSPEKLKESIAFKLKNAIEIEKDRFYYIYDVPQEATIARRRLEQVSRLKQEFPLIAFVGLEQAKDSAQEFNVLDLFLRLLCKVSGIEWNP